MLARRENSYSRFVAWVKIILPLGALALMSSLVLFSRSIDPEGALTYSELDLKDLARKQAVSRPTYSGVTSDGAAIIVRAKTARPEFKTPGTGSATDLIADIAFPDGARVHATAETGRLDTTARQADLTGNVRIETSIGYVMTTEALHTNLDATDIHTSAPVEGHGPLGQLNADRMHLSEDEKNPGSYLLVFQGGVKLIYQPQQ